jgi:hypothetical protein
VADLAVPLVWVAGKLEQQHLHQIKVMMVHQVHLLLVAVAAPVVLVV